MKKILALAFLALIFLPLQAKDGDQISLQAGTANVIWTLNSAFIQVDFSGAMVEGVSFNRWLQEQGDDYVRDWPNDNKAVEVYFAERFNSKTKKKKGLHLQATDPDDPYRMIIHVNDVDMGSIGGGVVATVFLGAFAKKSGGVNLKSGFIDVVEMATGKVLCRLGFNDVRGDSGLNMTAQLTLAFEDLHDEVIGFAKRFSQKQMPEITLNESEMARQLRQPEPEPEPEPETVPVYETAAVEEAPVAEPPVEATKPAAKSTASKSKGKASSKSKGKSSKSRSTASKSTTSSSSSTRTATSQAPAQATSAQSNAVQHVLVKLKDGTSISGFLKSFDPSSSIVLSVDGRDATIPMSNVSNVEMLDNAPQTAQTQTVQTQTVQTPTATPAQQIVTIEPIVSQNQTQAQNNHVSLGHNKLVVTESPDLPERINVTIDGIPVEMVLVKGGRMNMGYDGSGSLRMNSEPVHEVAVTSFYMSVNPLPALLVKGIVDNRNIGGTGNQPAEVRMFEDVEKVIYTIANRTGRNLRLPTEAEWEYAASGDKQNAIFGIAASRKTAYEWCSDFMAKFSRGSMVLTDPTGPSRGKEHVVRSFNGKRGKYDRSNDIDNDDAYLGLIRLVIKAVDIQ